MLCKEIDMKLYIIANRLPVKVAGTNGKFAFSRSEGGLATGLDSLPHSGAVVVLLTLCGMTHKDSYKQIFVTTVVITLIVAFIGIAIGSVMYPIG